MKSSEDMPREADMVDAPADDDARPDVPTPDDVRALLPQVSPTQYWLRRIDIPVQLGRIALLVLMWWLWWCSSSIRG